MAWTLQASRCLTLPRDISSRWAKFEVSKAQIQCAARRRHVCRFDAARCRRQSTAAASTSTSASPGGGDTLDLDLPPRLSLSIGEPCFSVSLTYDAAGGPLDGASRVV